MAINVRCRSDREGFVGGAPGAKRWYVVPHHCFKLGDGKYHFGGTVFSATEEEIGRQRYKVVPYDEEGPGSIEPPREASPEQMRPKRRGRPPKNRQMGAETKSSGPEGDYMTEDV